MTIPVTAVPMTAKRSLPEAVAWLQSHWVAGDHAAIHEVRRHGRWVFRIYTWKAGR